MKQRFTTLIITWAIIISASSTFASPKTDDFHLDTLLGHALENNPKLRAAEYI